MTRKCSECGGIYARTLNCTNDAFHAAQPKSPFADRCRWCGDKGCGGLDCLK